MYTAILKVDKRLEALECWHHQKSVDPIQKHVNKYEQRIIPEHNAIILLNYVMLSLSQKEPDKRKMIQNGSEINAQEKL